MQPAGLDPGPEMLSTCPSAPQEARTPADEDPSPPQLNTLVQSLSFPSQLGHCQGPSVGPCTAPGLPNS